MSEFVAAAIVALACIAITLILLAVVGVTVLIIRGGWSWYAARAGSPAIGRRALSR